MNGKKRIAVVPGSFDPITKGHLSIIRQAKSEYDTVYVAVMINEAKKYMFSLEEREEIARACLKNEDNVIVVSSSGWLWKLADELGACAIVKGYRNQKDLEYEKSMAEFNDSHCKTAKTVLIKADDDLNEISSTLVREKLLENENISDYLPKEAIAIIKRIQANK